MNKKTMDNFAALLEGMGEYEGLKGHDMEGFDEFLMGLFELLLAIVLLTATLCIILKERLEREADGRDRQRRSFVEIEHKKREVRAMEKQAVALKEKLDKGEDPKALMRAGTDLLQQMVELQKNFEELPPVLKQRLEALKQLCKPKLRRQQQNEEGEAGTGEGPALRPRGVKP